MMACKCRGPLPMCAEYNGCDYDPAGEGIFTFKIPQEGWVCPSCKRSHAPWLPTCPYCPAQLTLTCTDGST